MMPYPILDYFVFSPAPVITSLKYYLSEYKSWHSRNARPDNKSEGKVNR